MVFLDKQAWYSHKTDESFSLQLTEAVSMLVENFRAPLEAKATDLAAIQEEAKEMLDYAHQYLPSGHRWVSTCLVPLGVWT